MSLWSVSLQKNLCVRWYQKSCRSFSRKQQARKQYGEGFVAVFNSELGYYHYSQGIVHVSSFGFGGTNAHAIFWGEDHCIEHFTLREGLRRIVIKTRWTYRNIQSLHSDLAPQGCISCSNECRAFPKASSADVTPRGPSQWKWSGLSALRGGLPNAVWDRLNLAGSIQSFGVATRKKNRKKWKNWTIDVRCPRKDHNHKVPSSCNKIKNMEKYETIIIKDKFYILLSSPVACLGRN